MSNNKGNIDFTDKEKASKTLADIRDRVPNKHIQESIKEKLKYVNKPLHK